MATAVYGIARTRDLIERIVDQLLTEGLRERNISVLFADRQGRSDFADEPALGGHAIDKLPRAGITPTGVGLIAGSALGLLTGIGMLAIPGVGPLVAGGPIMSALGCLALGAAIGGIAGALIDMGVPESEARRYESRVNDGCILICVHVEHGDEVKKIRDVFSNAGAEDISTITERSVVSTSPMPHA